MESNQKNFSFAVHFGINATALESPNTSRDERLARMQALFPSHVTITNYVICCDIPPCEKRFSHGEGNVLPFRCVACEVGFDACLPCSVTQPLPCPKCQLPLESGAAASPAMSVKDDTSN